MTSLQDKLSEFGKFSDDEIPLSETALVLSSLSHPGLDHDRYRHHISKLGDEVAQRYHDLLQAGAEDIPQTKIAALKHVIADQFGYMGEKDNYNDLQNADLARVIEQRRGLPIALAILAIEAARRQKWDVEGLNFPGHFLLRIEQGTSRLIFDPFNQFEILEAHDLRRLIKRVAGEGAELSATYYRTASNRDILVRLQNNIKLRQIEAEDYAGALETVESMRLFAPHEVRLLLDAGVLYARTGQKARAIEALEGYVANAPSPEDRYDAQLLLQNLYNSP